jgi:hypothetical protein
MKKIIFTLLALFIGNSAFSQDTNIIKYLPLKVGNRWVYSYWVNQRLELTITGTVIANNHLYYIFQQNGASCTCPFAETPFLVDLQPMRVDSLTGNIMLLGNSCQWQSGEHVLDSLKERVGDNPSNVCVYSRCQDTNQVNVFGTVRNKRQMYYNNPYGFTRSYAQGIGIYNSYAQCTFSYSCSYSLLGCVINGVTYGDTTFPNGISQISSEIPNSFSLSQNYPNPFNPSTKISFSLPNSSNSGAMDTKLIIYDALGREVTTLVSQKLQPGIYQTEWDGTNYNSGVYFYKIEAGDFNQTKKMILIK